MASKATAALELAADMVTSPKKKTQVDKDKIEFSDESLSEMQKGMNKAFGTPPKKK